QRRGDFANQGAQDALRVESVPSGRRLLRDRSEVRPDRVERTWLRTEPLQLRVVLVAAGAPREYRLSEECLTPACEETHAVKVLRVQRPDSHFWPFRHSFEGHQIALPMSVASAGTSSVRTTKVSRSTPNATMNAICARNR